MSQSPKFTRPPARKQPHSDRANSIRWSEQEPKETTSANLYVANCGPAVGVSYVDVASAFSSFGEVVGVHAADESGARVIVCYASPASASAASEAWGGGRPCPELGGRVLHIRYSIPRPPMKPKVNDSVSVASDAKQLGIPGIYLIHDFVTKEEELKLLSELDTRPWNKLAKRRVQHYGYEFLYQTRNVDSKQILGTLPSFVSFIVERLPVFPCVSNATDNIVDQLTVDVVGGAAMPRAPRRVSFTFRKIRQSPCLCKYSDFCDSQQDVLM